MTQIYKKKELSMRKSLILGTALIALSLAPLAASQSPFSREAKSSAMTIDSRGVLTMAPLLESVTPAVVSIDVSGTRKTSATPPGFEGNEELFERFFGGRMPRQQERERRGIGSGVIVDAAKGLIITNHHVVEDADEITVTLEDKRELKAELVGSDPKTDIAVIKIPARGLRALKFARSSDVKVGDYVIAVGNPFGLSHSVTSGIISALGRDRGAGQNYQDFIQTDASINPGNSGGALVNSKGELIGINAAIVSRSGGNNGIGFAVPTRIVRGVMRQLVSYGEVRRGRIGVLIGDITPTLKEALDLPTLDGALVSDVVDDSPAAKAGLKKGDVIVAFNGEDIADASDIRNSVGLVEPGERADITYLRDGKRRTTRIEVEEFEEEREVLDESAADDIPVLESFSGASITDIPDDMELRGGTDGVLVKFVKSGSKASRAGLRAGDIIREVNRKEVSNLDDFEAAIDGKDGPFALSVERDGRNAFIAVK